ncbi:MAG TPA: class I SAM-dependent methyltransferase [Chthoniobacterales bacterium]|nr:class I SAM-dependent methyltransferase [Chthoniobacterales bacterium]
MAYEELKERQSRMWGSGPYQRVTETIADIHDRVVRTLNPQPGEPWLDLACGTGSVAERAARAGAKVTGLDLAPALLEQAKARAQAEGLEIDYQEGDCERLEGIGDGCFDVVSSTCGIMFAPDHSATARQLGRVLKPGGRLGLANWTSEGGLGAMFRMMAPFVQTPPPSSPFDWGKEVRVRELLGEMFELRFEKHVSMFRPSSGEEYWEIFSADYGPTKTLADSLGPRREEFHRTWVDFFEQNYKTEDGGIAHDREWLLVLGTKK